MKAFFKYLKFNISKNADNCKDKNRKRNKIGCRTIRLSRKCESQSARF